MGLRAGPLPHFRDYPRAGRWSHRANRPEPMSMTPSGWPQRVCVDFQKTDGRGRVSLTLPCTQRDLDFSVG